jgi:hypothetical protein
VTGAPGTSSGTAIAKCGAAPKGQVSCWLDLVGFGAPSMGRTDFTGPSVVHMTIGMPFARAGPGIQPTGMVTRNTIATKASQRPAGRAKVRMMPCLPIGAVNWLIN